MNQRKGQGKGKMKVMTEARIKQHRAQPWQNKRQVQGKDKDKVKDK